MEAPDDARSSLPTVSQDALRELRDLLEELKGAKSREELRRLGDRIVARMAEAQKQLVQHHMLRARANWPIFLGYDKTLMEARETLDYLTSSWLLAPPSARNGWKTWPDPPDVVQLADTAGVPVTEAWKVLGGGSEPLDEAVAEIIAGGYKAVWTGAGYEGVATIICEEVRRLWAQLNDKDYELQCLKSDAKVALAVMTVGMLIAIVSGMQFLGYLSGCVAFCAWLGLLHLLS